MSCISIHADSCFLLESIEYFNYQSALYSFVLHSCKFGFIICPRWQVRWSRADLLDAVWTCLYTVLLFVFCGQKHSDN